MMNWEAIARAAIKPSTQAEEVLFADGDTDDIVSVILHGDRLAAPFTADFAPYFRSGATITTGQKVWDFVKSNIRYKKDKNGHERIKSPGKLWADKEGDCKSMSIFVASILQNLGIPYKYRFAHYPNPSRPWDKDVNHVFVVAMDATGREIPIDPVADRYNYEEPYEFSYDHEAGKAAQAKVSGLFPEGGLKAWAPLIISFLIGYMTATIASE